MSSDGAWAHQKLAPTRSLLADCAQSPRVLWPCARCRLPEHPGGSTIIPQQALNVEAGRFFEIYHSSRESFTFLKHFYVGELRPEDRDEVPLPQPKVYSDEEEEEEEELPEGKGVRRAGHAAAQSLASEPASQDFLVALRECTSPFRRSFTKSKH
eukprot:COSAG01_NODE_19108_length_1030_cov_2.505908_1_plen_154_part_10